MRDWSTARAWLYRELTGETGDGFGTLATDRQSAAVRTRARARGPFLRLACAADDALEREVLSHLIARHNAGNFLERPALEVAARAIAREQQRFRNRPDGFALTIQRTGQYERSIEEAMKAIALD
jgi:hypothetical protein